MNKLSCFTYLLILLNGMTVLSASAKAARSNVVLAENIKWGYLNPLRGDKSPRAAELWGDRSKNVATGMLVNFKQGFSSPPHIHNISYRGIVIDGLLHNDDPAAKEMWMPQGSFWTQPAGENHITAASGQSNLIYLEIDSGPYLVKPSAESFDNGQSPLNIHYGNLTWLNASDATFMEVAKGAKITPLWGSSEQGQLGGALLKLSAGFNGTLQVDAQEFRAVVIKGSVKYESSESRDIQQLSTGSYFDSVGKFKHNVALSKESLIYIRTNGRYRLTHN
ncbi:hypothetical protein PSECIP111854_00013 [Pseudoalteromonas sp. CIP111854]|uniref:DUF4437 domain-containing protein n=2 Tax=Pseudoalteromonas holothuriae TaxID=2963714 RepID=A0A9W4QQK3_9GAMM|nr:hypothetical protein PSECIP111854_00013 [Pseudoalteromonas sp. CIP111854]